MNKFSVVGIGPGHADYLLPVSLKAVSAADMLIGGSRQLNLFRDMNKKEIVLKGNYEDVFLYIKNNYKNEKIAVLVSGDPGYHSLLKRISDFFSDSEYRVFPGLSSFQLAMTRIGQIWNDAALISLHGKKIDDIAVPVTGRTVFLTDYKNTPKVIADFLLSRGFKGRDVVIAENLSYPNERIRTVKLEEIKEEEYKLCVMIIR